MFSRNRNESRRTDVKRALEEWQEAKRYFESVSDPDLIEYAIFGEEAARRKYTLLLRRYACEGGAEELEG